MVKTKRYTQEFKNEAIKLSVISGNITKTARDLGIPESTLHTWVINSKKDNIIIQSNDKKIPNKKINVGELMSELQDLKKKLARAEQEKEILKKATAFFAQDRS
jgi:transposase